jgi:hypothetical protein
MPRDESVRLEAGGEEVTVSNPSKVFFAEPGLSNLDLVYY